MCVCVCVCVYLVYLMEGRCEDESTKSQRVSQYIQSLLVVGNHITTKCISHHKRERGGVLGSHKECLEHVCYELQGEVAVVTLGN